MSRVPIYTDDHETYRADSCQPLIAAVKQGRVRFAAFRHGHYPGRALRTGSLPGLKMIGVWDAHQDQSWGLSWHRNEGIELAFLDSGNLRFGVDDAMHEFHANDLAITRPWQRHCIGNPNVQASRLYWLILDIGVRRPHENWAWPSWLILSNSDLRHLTELLRHSEQPMWASTADIRRCFRLIGRALADSTEEAATSQLVVRINELFLLLLEMFRTKRFRLDSSLASTRRTVDMFLRDVAGHAEHLRIDWTLESMARQCGLGITQFVNHVKGLTNMAPMQYLNHCRLELAAKLLKEQQTSNITETAFTCGFSSGQYFATVFARHFGCSPRQYRRAGGLNADERASLSPDSF